jgi:hypothetical protein
VAKRKRRRAKGEHPPLRVSVGSDGRVKVDRAFVLTTVIVLLAAGGGILLIMALVAMTKGGYKE